MSKIKMSTRLPSSEASLLGLYTPVSPLHAHRLFPLSSFCKDTKYTKLGPTLVTHFNLMTFVKIQFQVRSRSEVPGVRTSAYEVWEGGTFQPLTDNSTVWGSHMNC